MKFLLYLRKIIWIMKNLVCTLFLNFACILFCIAQERNTLSKIAESSGRINFEEYVKDNLKPRRGAKLLDEYYEDLFRVKVFQDGDSIKLYSYGDNNKVYRLETYKIFTDSIKERWGTQIIISLDGIIDIFQIFDPVLNTELTIDYDKLGRLSKEIFNDKIKKESTVINYYSTGTIKNSSLTKNNLDGSMTTSSYYWSEDGKLLRDQISVDGVTTSLKTYSSNGNLLFRIPLEQGDTIYINNEGAVTNFENASFYAIVDLQGDSIKVNVSDMNGRLTSIENYKTYTPETVVQWGVQKYFYRSTPEPKDSLLYVRSVLGNNLREVEYYEDGNVKSLVQVSYDGVMVPIKELRQYFPTGQLRRYQKRHGGKIVEGHLYDVDGKEINPYIEFNE